LRLGAAPPAPRRLAEAGGPGYIVDKHSRHGEEVSMAEWFPLSEDIKGPHKGHGKHLCVAHVMNYIQTNLADYKQLVRNGKYVCKQCGRVAASADYLCDPDQL
jgi:hypothetical protein